MKRFLAALGLCWLLVLSIGPGAAHCAGPDESAHAAALHDASEGQRLYRQERYAEALEKFRQAHRAYPSPDLLVYMAACLLAEQRDFEALHLILDFFAEPGLSRGTVFDLALRLWQDAAPTQRQEVLGVGGERLPDSVLRRLSRLPAARRQLLPVELQRLLAPVPLRGPPDAVPGRPQPQTESAARPSLLPGLLLAGAGLATLSIGAALLAVNDNCASPGDINHCELVYRTDGGGYTALVLGMVAFGAGSAWALYNGVRRGRSGGPRRTAAALRLVPSGGGWWASSERLILAAIGRLLAHSIHAGLSALAHGLATQAQVVRAGGRARRAVLPDIAAAAGLVGGQAQAGAAGGGGRAVRADQAAPRADAVAALVAGVVAAVGVADAAAAQEVGLAHRVRRAGAHRAARPAVIVLGTELALLVAAVAARAAVAVLAAHHAARAVLAAEGRPPAGAAAAPGAAVVVPVARLAGARHPVAEAPASAPGTGAVVGTAADCGILLRSCVHSRGGVGRGAREIGLSDTGGVVLAQPGVGHGAARSQDEAEHRDREDAAWQPHLHADSW